MERQRSAGPVLLSPPTGAEVGGRPAHPTADREAEAGALQPPELTQLIKARVGAVNRLYRVRQKDTVAAAETERTADHPPLVAPRNMAERVAGPADIPVQSELGAVDHYTPPERVGAEDQVRARTVQPVEHGEVIRAEAAAREELPAQVQPELVGILVVETAEAEEMERAETVGPEASQEEEEEALVEMLVKRAAPAQLVLHVFGRGDGIQGHSGDRRTVGSPGRRRCVGDHIPATLGERLPGAER